MPRLFAWDYRTPYFYMITIKRLAGLKMLAYLTTGNKWGHFYHPFTALLVRTLELTKAAFPGIASLSPYVIMPEHLHILVKIANVPNRPSLIEFGNALVDALDAAYNAYYPEHRGPAFDRNWHDLIVKKDGQLENFDHYIRSNVRDRLLRNSYKERFAHLCQRAHWRLANIPFDMVGQPGLLNAPAIIAIRGSRAWTPDCPQWQNLIERCSRWRPEITAVGTWLSDAEKAARRAILQCGGKVIILTPFGMSPCWHPKTINQNLCAKGKLLFLSPYQANTQQLPKGETRARCLQLNTIAERMQTAVYGTASRDFSCAALPVAHNAREMALRLAL